MSRKISLETAKGLYVHRYTLEHIPEWARKSHEGKFYAPQYRTDSEWYDNTLFPGEDFVSERSRHCYTNGQTWPLGKWLAKPLPADLGRDAAHNDLSLAALRDVLEWREEWHAPRYSNRAPAIPGRYVVAAYRADWSESPIVYDLAAFWEHRTLGAACRRLARLIARRSPDVPRFDSLYIVTPEGERLPLKAARERIARNG